MTLQQTRAPTPLAGTQRSLDDLGTPLIDVTFCVLDVETTGTSPIDDRICEIGAVKVRGGAVVGTFHTMVDPERDIPPTITMLNGLTSAEVRPAPRIDEILPSLAEFMDRTVFVGHNVRFDRAFLDAARARNDLGPLPHPTVDTCALSRRLLADEVPNHSLGTLAERLRLSHRPTHRALDDALATVELLHLLLERAAGFGALGLDDLLALPRATGHPQAAKLRLTDGLPRAPGVYVFRDGGGRVLYVGKATNLRARVRSYFSSDTRRKVGGLLREAAVVDHRVTDTPLEAAVAEIRLIHEHLPRYNRQGTTWHRSCFLVLTDEAFPRLSIVRRARDDGRVYLGPLASKRSARSVADAIEAALPIRRCVADPARTRRAAPCTAAQLGVSVCPCAGTIGRSEYAPIAAQVAAAMTTRADVVTEPLLARMRQLSTQERFEEAADVRDRLRAFVSAHRRVRRLQLLQRAGRMVLRHGDRRIVLDRGLLVTSEPARSPSLLAEPTRAAGVARPQLPGQLPGLERHGADPVQPGDADEVLVVSRWLETVAPHIELEHVDGSLHDLLPRLPDLEEPARPGRSRRRAGR